MLSKGDWGQLLPWRKGQRVLSGTQLRRVVRRNQQTDIPTQPEIQKDNGFPETLPRALRLFNGIDQANGIGLEFGALDKPAALPSVGRVYYADYVSTDELKRLHSATPTVNTDQIVNVDFIFGDRPMRDVVLPDLKFDYVVASHCIEHVPNVIGWLREISEMLGPGGVVSLIVPDKNYTFDLFRRETTETEFLAAYVEKRRRPSPAQVYDFYRWHARPVDHLTIWSKDGEAPKPNLVHTRQQALGMAELAMSQYVDSHCSVFTPASFMDFVAAFTDMKLLPYTVRSIAPTARDEMDFFVQLQSTLE